MADAMVSFRRRFPALEDSVHLASCSQGALSDDLTAALGELQRTLRDHGVAWDLWLEEVERLRAGFAALINAEPEQIALVSCASEAAFQVASTRAWSRRPKLLTTDMEFPSVSHVWLAQRASGADVVHVRANGATVDADDYARELDGATGLVSIPLVSYRNGVRLPVEEVVARARANGSATFVDGYQACGVIPVDVSALECDFFVSGAQKYLLGLPGVACLYVRDGVADQRAPQLTGWFGRKDPFAFDPYTLDFPASARRFEVGTPPMPSVYAANAGLGLLRRLSPAAVEATVNDLVASLSRRLLEAGERLWLPPSGLPNGAMVALHDTDPAALAAFLAARRIVTAPRGPVLRLSFHAYNDATDVDAVCDAISTYRRSAAVTAGVT